MSAFWAGFEKQAGLGNRLMHVARAMADNGHAIKAVGGLAGVAAAAGAASGHLSHVGGKIDKARQGKDHEAKTFIEKHPKLTGAASLGLAPALSRLSTRAEDDDDNEKVRQVRKDHPVAGRLMTGGGR
jgi:hypothetical protein